MRCQVYQLPAELYRELEAQILEQLRDSDREHLLYLLEEHDLRVDLLCGEWRLLFEACQDDHYVEVNEKERRARMAVSPDELADFVERLRSPEVQEKWSPVSFGLAELADALPVGVDLVGLVFVEESDDWEWVERRHELMAIRPEVHALLEPYMQRMLEAQDYPALARLCSDHCEGSVEFSVDEWTNLIECAQERAPELLTVIDGVLAHPRDYTSIREAIAVVADPSEQHSLDAWLRVHADQSQYAFFFRDIDRE